MRHPHVIRSLLLLGVVGAMCAAALSGCGDGNGGGQHPKAPRRSGGPRSAAPPAVQLERVGRFAAPLVAAPVPGTDQMAVAEKSGRVLVVSGMVCSAHDKCPARPVTTGKVVLDLHMRVSTGAEQGLLGFAFHPDWPDDDRVFVDYTDGSGDTHVEAWRMSTPTAHAVRDRELLRIDQPYPNHNGGHLAFGPDGLLYIGSGDGGSAGDPGDRAQSPDERLGKLLRIDVNGGGERGFAIPEGNLKGGAPEVWALGLRNPWRFSFDSETGDLWIGDVGQDTREEIDALPASALDAHEPPNFQWRLREGFTAFSEDGKRGPGRWTAPLLDYGRTQGCSVTGGYVYRGAGVPDLRGWYVFADYCGSDLRMLRVPDRLGSGTAQRAPTWSSIPGVAQTASFATTAKGELLVLSLDGSISQVVAAPT